MSSKRQKHPNPNGCRRWEMPHKDANDYNRRENEEEIERELEEKAEDEDNDEQE
jgi:hypothetical protein